MVLSGHKLATAGSESKEASVGKLLRGQETSVAGAGSQRRPLGVMNPTASNSLM